MTVICEGGNGTTLTLVTTVVWKSVTVLTERSLSAYCSNTVPADPLSLAVAVFSSEEEVTYLKNKVVSVLVVTETITIIV